MVKVVDVVAGEMTFFEIEVTSLFKLKSRDFVFMKVISEGQMKGLCLNDGSISLISRDAEVIPVKSCTLTS